MTANRFEKLNDPELFVLINLVHSALPADVDHIANQMFEGRLEGKVDLKGVMEEMIDAVDDVQLKKTIKKKAVIVNRG